MATKTKETPENKKTESKMLEGFKFGFGFYMAFLTGSLLLAAITALIWLLMKSS